MKEAAELATSTQILMNVSEFTDISTATDSLISSIQAFKYTAEESMDVVDILNTIGNNYAISTADLATSLTKSSGSLVAANGTLEEAVALTASANTIIQDADVVGTALKTVAMRLRGTSVTEMEEEGLDTEGAVESKSKLQSKVQALSGVNILTDTGAYKSTYQILSEISEVWENINDMDQAALLEILAGKRAGSVMAAILENPDTLKDAFESANNATGSALKENETYLDSIQGKMDLFTNSVQTMWQDTIGSEAIKIIVEIGTWLIKLVDNIGLINGVLIATSLIIMKINHMNLIEFFSSISGSIVNAAKKFLNFGKSIVATNTVVAKSTDLTTVSSFKNAMAVAKVDDANKSAILSQLGLTGANNKQAISRDTLTASTLSAMVAEGKLTEAQANTIMGMLGITTASNEVNAARMNELLTAEGLDKAQKKQIITQLGLSGSLKKLTYDEAVNAFMTAGMSKQDAVALAAKLGLTKANVGLAASFGLLVKSMLPMLILMGAILAIVGVVKLFDALTVTAAELSEELDNLKTELSELESDIESINDELETTQDRMAELIAMPSLSFVEQEELQRLREQTAELERQLEIKKTLAEAKEAEITNTSAEYIDAAWNSTGFDKPYTVDYSTGEVIDDVWYQAGVDTKDAIAFAKSAYARQKEAVDAANYAFENWDDLSEYERWGAYQKLHLNTGDMAGPLDYFNFDKEELAKKIKETEGIMAKAESSVYAVFGDEHFQDLRYGMSKEIDAFLDEYNNEWIKSKMYFDDYTASDAINRIIKSGDADTQKLAEDISNIMSDGALESAEKTAKVNELISESVDKTSRSYNERLAASLESVFGSLEKGTTILKNYYTQMSEFPDSSTIEGITKQYQLGVDALNKYSTAQKDANAVIAEYKDVATGKTEQITWDSLFDDETGEVLDTQISKVLKGADESTRKEFARIVKSVQDGTMDIDNAITSFSGSGLVAVSKLIEESFGELNKSVFKNLEDDISGFIDTFKEFSAALEDVADSIELLNTAQKQFDNSGQVSVKTALELIESTDRWNEILYVENGQIKLNANAQDILAQSKLDTVKANLAEAKASIQNQLAQLGAADATLLSAEASDITTEAYTIYTNAMNSYTASIAGFGAALDAIVNKRWGDVIGDFQTAYNAAQKVVTHENNTNIEGLRTRLAEINTMEDFLESIDTIDEFENNYDFDKTPGDKKDDYESEDDRFKRAMDYWENRIGANQARYEQLQNEIDLLESKGQKADASYYEEQIKLEEQRLSLLKQQKAEAQKFLGTFAEGSDEWFRKEARLLGNL